MSKIASNYSTISKRIQAGETSYVVLGDGNIYKSIFKWKNDPEEGDIIGFFTRDEFRIGYITESNWDTIFYDWFYTTINLLPFIARVHTRSLVSRRPSQVPLDRVSCVFRKVKKAKKKGD